VRLIVSSANIINVECTTLQSRNAAKLESQGPQREVKHSASPLVNINKGFEALKERNIERP
jgi:hypothetical protein